MMFNNLVKAILLEMPVSSIKKMSNITNMPQIMNPRGYEAKAGVRAVNRDTFLNKIQQDLAKNIPININIVFYDIDTTTRDNIDEDYTLKHIKPDPDAVTCVLSFRGGEPITKWMVCHFIAHAITEPPIHPRVDKYILSDDDWDIYNKITNHIKMHTTSKKEQKVFEDGSEDENFIELCDYVAKMSRFKSARTHGVPFIGEYVNELIAEYLYTGNIKIHDGTPEAANLASNIKQYALNKFKSNIGNIVYS